MQEEHTLHAVDKTPHSTLSDTSSKADNVLESVYAGPLDVINFRIARRV